MCQLVRFSPGAGDTEHRYRCSIVAFAFTVSVEAPIQLLQKIALVSVCLPVYS